MASAHYSHLCDGGWVGKHGDEVDGEHEFDGKEEDGMQAEDAFETTNEGGGDGSEGEDCFENPPQRAVCTRYCETYFLGRNSCAAHSWLGYGGMDLPVL